MRWPTLVAGITAGFFTGGALGWWARAPVAPVAGQMAAAADPRTWVQRVVADCPPAVECPDRPQDVPEVALLPHPFDDLEPRPDDRPVPWPDDAPPELLPGALEAELREVVEACGAEGIVDVDCSEPPCLVVYEGHPDGAGPACPAWNERFGGTVSRAGDSSMCPDGTERSVSVIGPYFEETNPPFDPEDAFALGRRMRSRARRYTHGEGCAEPLTLEVENVPGHELVWVAKR